MIRQLLAEELQVASMFIDFNKAFETIKIFSVAA